MTKPQPLLELKPVGEIKGRFVVARYQRGYRWTKHEVTQLLEDLHGNGRQHYSLQPIVVKARADGRWELIDGQQRLTTLLLILRYMEREKLKTDGPRYSIEYETRPGSEAFLRDPDAKLRTTNIDFHHMFEAYECIREWFEAFGMDRQLIADDVYAIVLKWVRVVWYIAPFTIEPTELFTRLNVGRIPLTDAELVKALLVTLVGRTSPDRALEFAADWDRVEKDLWDREIWAFVCGAPPDIRPTRITLLLDTMAGVEGTSAPYYTFAQLQARMGGSADDARRVWGEVLDLHALVMGWFASRPIFHKIGYLVRIGVPFPRLVREATGRSKSAFEARLVELIRKELALSKSAIRQLTYEKDSDKLTIRRLLLLMNVETVSRREDSSERYQFGLHNDATWSLEHIHAQNSEDLVRAEQWEAWRTEHLAALRGLPSSFGPDDRQRLVSRLEEAEGKLNRISFPLLAADVGAFFTAPGMEKVAPEYGLHGVANLALLRREDNAALNNAAFEVKRRRILSMDRTGAFIPICTRQVFLKYYSESEGQQMHLWSPADREAYLDALLEVVAPYLEPDEVET